MAAQIARMFAALVLLSCASISAGSAWDSQALRIRSNPVYSYKQDCGKNSTLHIKASAVSFLKHANVPGAGVDEFTPFETVLKDGFMPVDCVKDYMYYHGDKFGDNRHDYKVGSTAGVSIVHYDAFVDHIDQQPMTQQVCFEFCRTVPNMGFFGLVNGRGCYCTPYYEAMAGDSSMCDAFCEGDSTVMCGGRSKSSVFAMHMCSDTESQLSQSSNKAQSIASAVNAKVGTAKKLSASMQSEAEALQKTFGAVGDTAATGLMQEAKVAAGTLLHKAEEASSIAAKLGALAKAASGLTDFTNPQTVSEADDIIEDTETASESAEMAANELDELVAVSSVGSDVDGAAKQYYPVMYFVDKSFEKVPSTCAGTSVSASQPIVGESRDACASACDSHIHSCVGFQYFDGSEKLCFLFSKLTSTSYYTGCGSSFLQMRHEGAPFEATCYAKLSKFEGTNLKPDPSGKSDFVLKTLTKADRCYQ